MSSSRVCRLLPVGARVKCVDTSGAKELQIIGYPGLQGAKGRLRTGGVAMEAIVTVKKGPVNLKGKVHRAVIVRQKAPIHRLDTGIRIRFQDNAAVLLLDKMKKIPVKGVVAKEVLDNPVYSNLSCTPV